MSYGNSQTYFGGPYVLFVPPQLFNVAPHLNRQYAFINVDFRSIPVAVSRIPVPGSKVLPRALSTLLDPPIVLPGPSASANAPPPSFNRKYHSPPAPDPNDEDLGPEVEYDGTKTENVDWLVTTQQYHKYLLRTHNFPTNPPSRNPPQL